MTVEKKVEKGQPQKPPVQHGMTTGLSTLHLMALGLMSLVTRNALRMENAHEELGFYWIYHSHPANQVIHFFFVPVLVWTLNIWLVHLEIPLIDVTISPPFLPTHRINQGTIWMSLGALLYTNMDPVGGTLYLPVMYFFLYGTAVWLHEQDQRKSPYKHWYGTGRLFQWPLLVHALSWATQIYGHAHFDHGKPALVDSFAQSLTIAPLFAYYEGLWALGINRALQQQTLEQAAVLTKELCASGTSVMNVCQVFPAS